MRLRDRRVSESYFDVRIFSSKTRGNRTKVTKTAWCHQKSALALCAREGECWVFPVTSHDFSAPLFLSLSLIRDLLCNTFLEISHIALSLTICTSVLNWQGRKSRINPNFSMEDCSVNHLPNCVEFCWKKSSFSCKNLNFFVPPSLLLFKYAE